MVVLDSFFDLAVIVIEVALRVKYLHGNQIFLISKLCNISSIGIKIVVLLQCRSQFVPYGYITFLYLVDGYITSQGIHVCLGEGSISWKDFNISHYPPLHLSLCNELVRSMGGWGRARSVPLALQPTTCKIWISNLLFVNLHHLITIIPCCILLFNNDKFSTSSMCTIRTRCVLFLSVVYWIHFCLCEI